MATREQLERALRNADKAGDVDAARRLAAAIKSLPVEESQPQQEDGFSPVELVKNIPSSAANVASGMWDAVTNPRQVARTMNDVATGVGVNFVKSLPEWAQSDKDEAWIAKNQGADAAADAAGDYYKNRYGSFDKALNTLEQDPVGAILDMAGGVSLLGGGARLAGMGKTADALQKTSAAVNPINAAMNTGKVAASHLIPKSAPGALYESAVKFGTTVDDRPRLIDRALTEKLMPTEAGIKNLQGYISDAQKKVLELIDEATQSGQTIQKGVVLKGIKQLKDSYRNTPEGSKAIAQIDDMSKQFLIDDLGDKGFLTPSDLQRWKVKAYDKINYNAKRNVDAPVKEEVLKTTARAAKNEIEDAIPNADIKGLNARQGELLELQAPLQKSANRISNRNLVSIDTPLKMSAGGFMGQLLGDPVTGAAVGTAASILGNPKVKAWMAIQLDQLKKTGDIGAFVRNNPHLSQAEIAAYASQVLSNASPQGAQSPTVAPLLGQ